MSELPQIIELGAEEEAKRLAEVTAMRARMETFPAGQSYAVLGDFHLAEDASQEAFIDAYRRLPELRAPEAHGDHGEDVVEPRDGVPQASEEPGGLAAGRHGSGYHDAGARGDQRA